MKVVFVGSGFTGATLPLANHLARKGHKIVFYNFVQWNVASIESIDLDTPRRLPLGQKEQLSKSNKLYRYLDNSVDFYFLPFWKRRGRSEKLLVGKIFPWLNRKLNKKYAQYVIDEKADYVNVLIYSANDLMLAKSVLNAQIPLCITYHEVLQNLTTEEMIRPVVAESLNFGTPIIVHSQYTARKLISLSNDNGLKQRLNVINFGPFESFLSYGEGKMPEGNPQNYLLYIGHVHPYKGLKVLYEALNLIDSKLFDAKIVVAGGGYDPAIDKMKNDSRFIVYNHFIDNAELVWLFRNCRAVICPYIAASQSGLVQTAMVFEKPIIATTVGAFVEFVRDGENGLLCEPSSSRSLAQAIEKMINNTASFGKSVTPNSLSWDAISARYIQLFDSMTP